MPQHPSPPNRAYVVTSEPRVVLRDMMRAIGDAASFVTMECLANLLEPPSAGGTPVDTTLLRTSWIASAGSPSAETGGFQISVGGGRAAVLDEGPQLRGIAMLATWTPDKGPLFLTNNQPYAGKINRTGKHAGYVDSCLTRAVNTAESRLKL